MKYKILLIGLLVAVLLVSGCVQNKSVRMSFEDKCKTVLPKAIPSWLDIKPCVSSRANVEEILGEPFHTRETYILGSGNKTVLLYNELTSSSYNEIYLDNDLVYLIIVYNPEETSSSDIKSEYGEPEEIMGLYIGTYYYAYPTKGIAFLIDESSQEVLAKTYFKPEHDPLGYEAWIEASKNPLPEFENIDTGLGLSLEYPKDWNILLDKSLPTIGFSHPFNELISLDISYFSKKPEFYSDESGYKILADYETLSSFVNNPIILGTAEGYEVEKIEDGRTEIGVKEHAGYYYFYKEDVYGPGMIGPVLTYTNLEKLLGYKVAFMVDEEIYMIEWGAPIELYPDFADIFKHMRDSIKIAPKNSTLPWDEYKSMIKYIHNLMKENI